MTTKRKICIVTLGCPKNIVDSEHLLAHLASASLEITPDVNDADTVIINTCGFIQDAKQESIDAILEAVERKKEGTLKNIFVMGCLSERYRAELQKEIPEVDAYFGTSQWNDILTTFGADYKKELLGERYLTTPSHFAYLKISEGCDRTCSFCAIPLMRGKHRSVPREELLTEARRLAEKGVQELIVIAQDTTSYGIDLYGRRQLAALLKELNRVDGIQWIRLLYAYPAQFPDDLFDAFHLCEKLCHYLDIPLQHVSDSVLRSMRRGSTEEGIRKLLTRLKKEIPDIALRTTLIVGYPGETDEDFQRLHDFVAEMQFHRLGVFPYSQEEGTDAFPLGDPIPQQVKQERLDALMTLQRRISLERNESLIGSIVKVLVDEVENEYAIGRTPWDAPEIDQEVTLSGNRLPSVGTIIPVRITAAAEYDLEGKPLEHTEEMDNESYASGMV